MRRAVLLAIAATIVITGVVTSQELSRVGLVVVLEGGEAVTSCVEFEGGSISGFEALLRSGLTVENDVEGLGTTVCSIEGSGCPSNDCWCQCKGGDCLYWSYWHASEGEWNYSNVGAGMYQLSEGSVDGWVWDVGSPNDAPAPPDISFEEICVEDKMQEAVPELLVEKPLTLTPVVTAQNADGADEATEAEISAGTDAESAAGEAPLVDSPISYVLFGLLLVGLVLIWARTRK